MSSSVLGHRSPGRQAGGAIGIAASGAIASTDQLGPSLIGLHTTVLTTAGLFTPAALATAQWIPGTQSQNPI